MTPHRYPLARSASPKIIPSTPTTEEHNINPENKGNVPNDTLDDSDSYSNTSYVSAVGSQEDFTLVDLHMQVNRLIVDSPMLMSSYVTHLSQVRCNNWGSMGQGDQFSQPLFMKNQDDKLIYVGKRRQFIFCLFLIKSNNRWQVCPQY